MTVAAIIASAWASERERFFVSYQADAPHGRWLVVESHGDHGHTVFNGNQAACQAHLDQLCAAAAERALKAAGYAIVEARSDHVRIISGEEFDKLVSICQPLAALEE